MQLEYMASFTQVLNMSFDINVGHVLHNLGTNPQLSKLVGNRAWSSYESHTANLTCSSLIQWPIGEVPGQETFGELRHYFFPWQEE